MALAALSQARRTAAEAAVGAALVANALGGMETAQLTASGNVVLQFLAAHGAALTPILPRYQPSFAYQASPARHNVVAAELPVLGWFRGERGTMAGSVRLNRTDITRHGGHSFSVNFPHFVKTHLARYAEAGTLRGRTHITTFYPDTVTTTTFVANQLQAGLNAWPATEMTRVVAAINGRRNYNEIRQLTQGGFTFDLRVEVRLGNGALSQCYPVATAGGTAIQLSAARTVVMGQLLALLR